jgi:transcriptional regulator with XRE-family HTH domain
MKENSRIKLKLKRKSLGFNQKDVAALLGLSLSTYKSYEQGTRTPKINTFQKIAEILECKIDDLI